MPRHAQLADRQWDRIRPLLSTALPYGQSDMLATGAAAGVLTGLGVVD
ncbi:hypothetical protein [Streptomyces yatensis]|nr:hypothetical protein [Streptomyces yatensis]